MPKLPHQTPARWKVMKALADHGPLDRKQLADKSGVRPQVVRTTLVTPARARWVTVTVVPTDTGTSRKFVYEITDTGRRELAARTKEAP